MYFQTNLLKYHLFLKNYNFSFFKTKYLYNLDNSYVMKNMNRRIVNNILSSFEKKLIKREEIQKRFQEILKERYDKNIIKNLRQNNDILYIMFDYYYIVSPLEKSGHYLDYSTNEMLYKILNKQNIKWYLGLYSALEYNQIIWQGVVNPVSINNYFSGKRKIQGINYYFHKMKDDFFKFGIIENKTNNNIRFYYSDLEKTFLDFLYLKKRARNDLKKIINWKNLKKYLNFYPKSFKKKVYYQ